MNRINFSQRVLRGGLAVVAAALLVSGIAWHGTAAVDTHEAIVHAATTPAPLASAIAGGRDSYADIVDVVSPAVVTVRAQGRALSLIHI